MYIRASGYPTFVAPTLWLIIIPSFTVVPSSHQASQDASNHSLVTGTDTTYDRSNLTPEVPSSIGFSDNIRTECSTPSAVLESGVREIN